MSNLNKPAPAPLVNRDGLATSQIGCAFNAQ